MKSSFNCNRVSAILGLLLATAATSSSFGDDGASSIAAGGIVMVREPRITMQKEVLRISEDQVQVDYEFRNDTDADITTPVAFPVPAYSLENEHYPPIKFQGFEDFGLTVEGKPIRYDVEVRAKLKGRDVSSVLRRHRIDIASFGHLDEEKLTAPDIHRLPASQKGQLIRAGLLDKDDPEIWPIWSVEKKYYWQQTFPAHSVIHISHQYTPVLGGTNSVRYGFESSADPAS